jgi:hypothetical protein
MSRSSHFKFSQTLDKIERSLSARDLSQLWLGRALRFRNVADYSAWFTDAPESAAGIAVFERQVLNVMRSRRKSRWSESSFQLLHDIVFSLRIFFELNVECAQGCDQLDERLRAIADEAGEIFPKLRGKDRPAYFDDKPPWFFDDAEAMPGLAHHFAFDWYAIEAICEVKKFQGKGSRQL